MTILYEVELTPAAMSDARDIAGYLAEHRGQDEAAQFFASLLDCVDGLRLYALRGARPKEMMDDGQPGYRQTLLGRYRVIYHVHGTSVAILLVADGRRDMQALLRTRLLRSGLTD